VSWYESHNGGLWYSYRRPEGASWASPMLVDDMGDAGRYSAIGVHEGTVHITHLSGDTRQLRHAVWDGAAWQHEVVGQTLAEGQVLAVDLDAYGHAKLIAHDPTSGALTYLFQDDQGWYREIVAASGVTEGHADMVVTPQGALIAYYDEGTQGLYLAERDATGWQRQLVDAAADVGRYCSLGVSYLDRDEDFVWERNLHISYYDATSKRLKYAHHDPQEHAPGEWALQVVDDAGDVGRYASLVVDTHGDPHISYYCEDLGDLRYAQFDHVAGWITGTLDTEFDRGKYTRMTLAADGWPCIVYHHDDAEAIDETPTPGPSPTPTTGPSPTPTRRQSRLRFAHVAGSRWYTEEVGAYLTVPEVAGIEELVVAKAGAQAARPCILYRERVTGPLKVACQSGTEWTFSTLVDNPSALGPSAALADEWNDDLVLGYSLDGVVRISRTYGISPLLGVPGAALVPIRRDEPIVLSARDASQRDAGASGPSLGEGAAFMGEHASIAIDSAGRVHVAYQDVSRADLRYAWRDEGGAWHREIVDREGLAGDYASLMLDPTTGAPRIAYCVDAALRYAQRDTAAPDEGQWRAETVTQTVPDAVTHTSLALDALGRPRVAYHSRASIYGARLRYASWDGGAWNIVTPTLPVSATGGLYASLVLDGSGRPHIAHYDAHSDGLLYTHYDGGGWTSAQVVTGTLVGAYCDIALDAADRPHISAHGGKTLYHAWLEGDTWRIESDLDAEAEGIVGTHTSIAIAEDGALHIAYYDEEQARLKHAQRAPGEDWEIDVIDAAGDVGRYASLVCGTGGMLHVAYAGTSDGDCLYARYLPDAPTPTPTATVTPTSTPSPTPPGVPLYLPLVLSAAAP